MKFRLALNSVFFCLSLPNAEITGMYNYVWLSNLFVLIFKYIYEPKMSRDQKRACLELQAVRSCLIWVLGIELRFSLRAEVPVNY